MTPDSSSLAGIEIRGLLPSGNRIESRCRMAPDSSLLAGIEIRGLLHSGNRIETLYETPDPRSRKTLYRGIDAMNAVNQEFETLLLRHVWGREIDSLAQTAA